MVTVADLAALLGADETADAVELQHSLDVATALVERALTSSWRGMPDAVYDECIRRTADAVFRTTGTNAAGNTVNADGNLLLGAPNDPLRRSRDLIGAYVNRV